MSGRCWTQGGKRTEDVRRSFSASKRLPKDRDSSPKFLQESNRSTGSKQALNRPARPTTPIARPAGSISVHRYARTICFGCVVEGSEQIKATIMTVGDLHIKRVAILMRGCSTPKADRYLEHSRRMCLRTSCQDLTGYATTQHVRLSGMPTAR